MRGFTFWRTVEKLVGNLLKTFKTQKSPAYHQQRRDSPRRESADKQRCRYQNQLVDKRALGHGPNHRQFPVGHNTGNLLRVKRQIVAQHASGLFGRHLGQHGHVVKNAGDVVNQCKQATGHKNLS